MPRDAAARLLIIDDHALFREALMGTLSHETDLLVAGQAASIDEALEQLSKQQIHLVLLDINLGKEQGGAFLARARSTGFEGKVLALTAGVSDREAAWLLSRGCSGIFLKTDSMTELLAEIRAILNDDFRLNRLCARAIASQCEEHEPSRKPFTPREREVLRCVCEGLSNKEIAERLSVSENTAKAFLQQLFHKTGVRTRAQLVRVAIEQYWDQLSAPSP